MKILYAVCIGSLLVAGVGHVLLTFRKYQQREENAFWFAAAGLALVFGGFINWLHTAAATALSYKLAAITNGILATHLLALAAHNRRPHIAAVGVLALVALGCVLLKVT